MIEKIADLQVAFLGQSLPRQPISINCFNNKLSEPSVYDPLMTPPRFQE